MDIIEHPVLFYLLGIPISQTVVMTWILIVITVVIVLILRKVLPSLLETMLEFITGMVADVLDVDNLNPYLPLLGSLFIFILLSNMLSIVPGLKSPTSDINTTLALALVVLFSVQLYGIRQKGFWGYLKTFSDPIWLFPLEIVSQVSRTFSLTLRLFGNIMSGDLIVAIVFSIIPLIVPVAMMSLSLLTGVLQAYVFTILAALYIASAVEVNIEDEKMKRASSRKTKKNRKEESYGKS